MNKSLAVCPKANIGLSQITDFLLSYFLFYSPGTVSKDNFEIGNLKDYEPNTKLKKKPRQIKKKKFTSSILRIQNSGLLDYTYRSTLASWIQLDLLTLMQEQFPFRHIAILLWITKISNNHFSKRKFLFFYLVLAQTESGGWFRLKS